MRRCSPSMQKQWPRLLPRNTASIPRNVCFHSVNSGFIACNIVSIQPAIDFTLALNMQLSVYSLLAGTQILRNKDG